MGSVIPKIQIWTLDISSIDLPSSNVDELFYNTTIENNINEKIILEYFQYIKKKLHKDSIFRLLSPLLNIFFDLPNSRKFKTEIQSIMKSKKIDALRSLFFQFIDKQKVNINS